MKKKLLLVSVVLVALGAVTYRLVNQPPSSDLPKNEQMYQLLADAGCMACHVQNPELPFYASFPFVGDLVKEDVRKAYRAFDIALMAQAVKDGTPVSEVDLAKVEKVILDGTMPMAKYYLVHWGASITDTEKTLALDWIGQHRAANYPNPLAAAEFANEPVRPLPDSVSVDMRKVILGNLLYHDTRLSVDNTVSCATCHGLNTGGVDNKQFSEGVGGQVGGVNAPTVFNAHFNFVQFWDGRAKTLADQAGGPPLNRIEMGHKSFDDICAVLAKDAAFTKAFTEVYPDGLSQANITDAIQEFERTLITPNSRFDQYLKGNKTALNADEIAGYELFKKYNCATCHVGENMGGQSYELMGLQADYFADRNTEITVEDHGRNKETKTERDMHRFKVPGLRNIALTAPYFHDGSKKTLEEAVRDMAKYETGVQLNDQETAQLVSFLRTLTGTYKGQLLTNDNMK